MNSGECLPMIVQSHRHYKKALFQACCHLVPNLPLFWSQVCSFGPAHNIPMISQSHRHHEKDLFQVCCCLVPDLQLFCSGACFCCPAHSVENNAMPIQETIETLLTQKFVLLYLEHQNCTCRRSVYCRDSISASACLCVSRPEVSLTLLELMLSLEVVQL